MGIVNELIQKAKKLGKTIVLPEGTDSRVVEAAAIIAREGIANVVLIGNPLEIKAREVGLRIFDINDKLALKKYAELLYKLRKDKGLGKQEAEKLVQNPLYLGCLIVKAGEADGMVAGASVSTSSVLRPALQIIKTSKGIKTVSSCFIMHFPQKPTGKESLVFADCAVNIDPTAEQLVDIAISSVATARSLVGIEAPKVAMLSFSTKGSATHEKANKVIAATKLIKQIVPDMVVDGELQLDAALVPSVAAVKAPGSDVAGQADVLIFPDLNSGNIGYKIAQRFGSAVAIGPICQGFDKPVNDLSRGCSVEEIVSVVAITALQ